MWAEHEPHSVLVHDGSSLPRLDAATLAGVRRGWSYARGLLTIKENDEFEAASFTVQ